MPKNKVFAQAEGTSKYMNKSLILVVEDDTSVRNLITTTLKTHEYRYLTAPDGQSAILEASSHNPDIVLLDLGLPDMDGVEIIKKIRTWSNMPIIVISARSEDTDKIDALDAGADDYLTKPFSVEELSDIFSKSSNAQTLQIEYSAYIQKLNQLLKGLDIKSVDLAHFLHSDPSWVSRILSGQRQPSDLLKFTNSVADYIAGRFHDSQVLPTLLSILEIDAEAISNATGQTIYERDINNAMYVTDNVNNFFVGKNGQIYIVYPYGNTNMTSEIDVIKI